MRAFLRIAVVAALALTAALVAATHASARQACTAGTHGSSRTFCGPAHATLHDGGKTYTFSGGNCTKSGSTWTLNIGTITLSGSPKYDYFGITVFSAHSGTNSNPTISWQMPGGKHGSLYEASVTLTGGLKGGTFSGANILGGGKGTGSFSCS